MCATGLAAMCVVAPAGVAQTRPQFAGTWVLAANQSEGRPTVASRGDGTFRVGDAGTGYGDQFTLGVTAGEVSVEYNPYSAYDLQPVVVVRFALGGAPASNQVTLGHSRATFTGAAAWRGDTAVLTSRYPVPESVAGGGATVDMRQSLTLRDANTLVVETVRGGVAGAPATTTRTTYTRKP
jgi:hypothetical protein